MTARNVINITYTDLLNIHLLIQYTAYVFLYTLICIYCESFVIKQYQVAHNGGN